MLKDARYGFQTRFAEVPGPTNPEELIAAAHAGCFTMALVFQLQGARHDGAGRGRLGHQGRRAQPQAKVPGCGPDEFNKFAEAAKANCPVSKVLNAAVTLDAEPG